MKVLLAHNWYRFRGGEDMAVANMAAILERRGHEVALFTKDSRELACGLAGKLGAFGSGIYSAAAGREMSEVLRRERPDVVHAHNVYPRLSPSVLAAARRRGVPVVMTCHNYRLVCPTMNHYRRGKVCELCVGGREHWCVLKNCRENLLESIAYASRSVAARRFRWFQDNVTIFIALTEFGKRRLLAAGLDEERVRVLPNMVDVVDSPTDPTQGRYAAFVGRLSSEKGVDTLLEAARLLPQVPVRLAGDGPLRDRLVREAPPNVEILGQLEPSAMSDFYRKARLLVLPSRSFEMCPLVLSEAMTHGLPAIVSRSGGLPEIVDDGVTGYLFEPGDAEALAQRMRRLWEDPESCRGMGLAGRDKTIREYGEAVHFERLEGIYREAIARIAGRVQ